MAYFKRRRGHQVTVYYWEPKVASVVPLDRDLTRHLDGADDGAIRRWIDDWEAGHGRQVNRVMRRSLLASDAIAKLHKAHLDEWFTLHPSRSRKTRRYRELRFRGFVVPYFVEKHGLKDVRKWHLQVPDFPLHLLADAECSPRIAKRICQEVMNFGHYLARRMYIHGPWLIDAPTVNASDPTPLKAPILPKEAFAAAALLPAEWALVVLLGYFASLRPEETYALDKSDFLTGEQARLQAKTHKRFKKMKLGSGLSISITKSNTHGRVIDKPKTHYSYGIVNVWDKKAARLIADIVRELPDGPVYKHGRDHLNKLYKRIVGKVFKATAQNLRQASGLYLGRTLQTDPWLLQDHLRHASITTTMLYTRRPIYDLDAAGPQDFDDVG